MIAACAAFAEEIVAYLDGETGEAEATRIEAHLGTCLACRREVDRLRRLRALIGGLPAIEPSADFEERMWHRLDPLPARGNRRPRAALWIATPLAAAAVLALVWYSSISRPTGGAAGAGATAPAARSVAAAPRAHGANADAVAQRDEPERERTRDVAAAGDLDEYPPELVDHPELFLHLPVVRRLQRLQHFEEVRQHEDAQPLGQLAPTPSVG